MLLAFEQNIMEKIGFIHFAFIYVPIGYYYVVAWCEWQEMDFQPKPIKIHWFWFSNWISQIDSLLFGAAQFVSSLLINIQNNDAIHEYSWLGNGLLLVQLMFTTKFFFLLFFFFFYFSLTQCSTCMWCAPLLQIHRLIFDIQIPAARGAQLL